MKRFKILTFLPRERAVDLMNITEDVIFGFRALSQRVLLQNLGGIEDEKKREEVVLNAVDKYKPDFIFSIDTDRLPTWIFQKLKIPFLLWMTYDPTFLLKTPLYSEYCIIFVIDKSWIPRLKEEGFKWVHYLPLATDPKVFKKLSLEQSDLEKFGCNLSFTGIYRQSGGYWEDKDRFDKLFGKEMAEGIIERQKEDSLKDIDDVFVEILKEQAKEGHQFKLHGKYSILKDHLKVLELEAMARYREEIIKSISDFKIDLYGDSGWKEIENQDIKYKGRLKTREELCKLYNATKINLNLPTSSMKHSLNVNTFNIMASGAFMLHNFREDLVDLFQDEKEVVYFKDKDDLREKVDYYLKHDRERERIAANARKRVSKEHTFLHRVNEILRVI